MEKEYYKVVVTGNRLTGQKTQYIKLTDEEIREKKIQDQMVKVQDITADISDNEKLKLYIDSIPVDTTGVDSNGVFPHKLGFKWESYYNGNAFAWHLVADPDAIGTSEENAIIFYEGIALIDNAYYDRNGIICQYVGGNWVRDIDGTLYLLDGEEWVEF